MTSSDVTSSGVTNTKPLSSLQKKRLLSNLLAKKRGIKSVSQLGDQPSMSVQLRSDPASLLTAFPMTEVQQAYWLGRNAQFPLGGVASHSYQEFKWPEKIDLNNYKFAWQKVIARHPMIRTVVDDQGQFQTLAEVPELEITFQDLSALTNDKQQQALMTWREQLSHQCLPTDCWPLFEVRLSLLNDGSSLIHFSADALLWDVYSDFIIFRELKHYYLTPEHDLSQAGLPQADLPQPEVTFRDYMVSWLNSESYRKEREKAEAYWLECLQQLPAGPALPLVQPLEAMPRPQFERFSFELSKAQMTQLKQRAASYNITPSMLLLNAFADVLRLWSQETDFTLNLTLFNRPAIHEDIGKVVGDFTSTLLLPCLELPCLDNKQSDFVKRATHLQQAFLTAFEHRQFSGVDVLRARAKQQGGILNMLMPVVFTSALSAGDFSDQLSAEASFGEEVYAISQTPQVLLDHQVYERDGALVTNWDCVPEALPVGMFQAMLSCYQHYLNKLLGAETDWQQPLLPDLPAQQLSMLEQVNQTQTDFDLQPIHTGFYQQAQQTPDATAVVVGQQSLSYQQLAGYSQTLRNHALLNPNLSNRHGAMVAVWLPRGWEQMAAVMAVLANGAAYVPLNEDWPIARVLEILQAIDAAAIISNENLKQQLPATWQQKSIVVDDLQTAKVDFNLQPTPLETTAYIIFTSGSTGKPKGVVIDHRGAANTLVDIQQRFSISANDSVLCVSSLCFDLSVFDIFGMLAAGGKTVILPPAQERNPEYWLQQINQHNITVWNSVPAIFQMLCQYADSKLQAFRSLRLVMLSGDWLPVNLCQQLRQQRPELQLYSLGGATEASIWSVCYPVDEVDSKWHSIPYGKPLKNQKMYVLDQQLRPRPIGVCGDLYIAGAGLAREYWDNSEQNKRHFIDHPVTKERLYFTGDLARYHEDGNLEFLGRSDFQVKINGFRVELGEIETCLLEQDLSEPNLAKQTLVEQALVDVNGDKQRQSLVAYLINNQLEPFQQAEKLQQIKAKLEAKLPVYMLPQHYIWLKKFPMSANGKIDRSQLPQPDIALLEATTFEDESPKSEQETQISGILAGLLGVSKVSCQSNFLDLGANSLDLVKLQQQLEKIYPGRYKLLDLFEHSSVQKLAQFNRQHKPGSISNPLEQARARIKRRRVPEVCEK